MWRKDRFEEDVRKIGIKKVKMDLFNSPTTGKLNQYYGPDANPNPKLDRIETFCRYFNRPISYYCDLGEVFPAQSATFVGDNNIVLSQVAGEPERELQHLREIIEMQKQLLQSKEEQISILRDEANHWKFRYQELKDSKNGKNIK